MPQHAPWHDHDPSDEDAVESGDNARNSGNFHKNRRKANAHDADPQRHTREKNTLLIGVSHQVSQIAPLADGFMGQSRTLLTERSDAIRYYSGAPKPRL